MQIKSFYDKRYEHIKIGNIQDLSDRQRFTYLDVKIEKLLNKKICEIGVGPSGLIHLLKENFPNNKYFGVDLDENVIAYLKDNGFTVVKQDVSSEKLLFDDGFFDIVIFNEVIEHIFNCQHALNEIYRVLKPGGKLYISTHNSFNIFMRIKFLLGKIPAPSLDVSYETMGEHIRLFNRKILQYLLSRAGFF